MSDRTKYIRIQLTEAEFIEAAELGFERQICSIFQGNKDKHGVMEEQGWTIHVCGALAEKVVSKGQNLPWTKTINTFKKGSDIGPYQVRHACRYSDSLIIRDEDIASFAPETVFVLVIGSPCQLNFDIVGWYRLSDPRKEEWRKAPNRRPSAFFIPISELHSPPLP